MSAQPAQLDLPDLPVEPREWTREQIAELFARIPALNRDIESIRADNDVALNPLPDLDEDFEGDAADERARQFPEYHRDDPRR